MLYKDLVAIIEAMRLGGASDEEILYFLRKIYGK